MSLALRTLISLVTGLLLSVGLLTALPVAPADAGSTTLCTGYAGCAAAGYGDGGYSANSKSSYWRMYSGHNCTNYVAYRMVAAGMPNDRPFAGTGNAWNWGVQMATKTDQVPSVGAVAWFNKGVSGAGSVGHVAYVEQVVSPTEIVISEDSWGGDFHWRRITAGSGWPSGFIHLVDKPIVNTSPATVTGTPQVGQTLGSTPGGWAPAATIGYQWYLDGQPIAGATAATLKLTSGTAGHAVNLRVTASASGFQTGVSDTAPVTVQPGALATSGAPEVSGAGKVPLVGATLTASQPTFSPSPRKVSVQWYADGAAIPGATGWSYQLTGDTVLKSVTAVATGVRPGFSATPVTSAAIGPVLAGKASIDKAFTISGPARVGKKLRVAAGAVTPSDAAATYVWRRDGKTIDGAGGPTYTVAPEDVGAQLSVRVIVGRDGWLAKRTMLVREAVVAGEPTIVVKTKAKRSRASVWFKVEAPGVAKVSGAAVVTVGGRSRTVVVRKGVGHLVVTGLAAGKVPVTVTWKGTAKVVAGSTTTSVKVR